MYILIKNADGDTKQCLQYHNAVKYHYKGHTWDQGDMSLVTKVYLTTKYPRNTTEAD